MKVLLISFVLIFSFSLNGQNCRYAVKKFDAFEKKEIVLTEFVKVMYPAMSYPVVFLALGRVDSTYSVMVKLSHNKLICFSSSENELLLMTEDSMIYRLKRAEDKVACIKKEAYNYMGEIEYKIPHSTLLELQQKNLLKMRLYHSDGLIEVDLMQKNKNKKQASSFLTENIPCILRK